MKRTSDPKLHRELSQPFASLEIAQKSTEAFMEGVAELRKKHKIPDIHFVMRITWVDASGDETAGLLTGSWGDQLTVEPMVAYALGRIQMDRQQMIGELLAGGLKHGGAR